MNELPMLDENNPILLTDSYKASHWLLYPEALQKMVSYFESRGGVFKYTLGPVGLQIILMRHLVGPVITQKRIDEAQSIIDKHIGPGVFNREGWEHILHQHGGRLPLLIKAVPEGTVVPTKNVLVLVESTCTKCAWTVNYYETLLVQVWYSMTVATLSHAIKASILKNLDKTGTPSQIGFKLHDFGFRGVSSVESAGIGGLAHLVNFLGTDTMQALVFARNYYGADMAGFSIPAAEHSTIVSWLRSGESAAFGNALNRFPGGLLAMVSDTYNIYEACRDKWGTEFRDRVLQREGTLIIRPDSGDPRTVVLRVLDILGEKFGTYQNAKGYRVLNDKVRVIQGDGVNLVSIVEILDAMEGAGWSGDNIAFGMGGALLQGSTRDTQKCAFKASQVVVDAIPHDVWKDPVTDPGKKSKRGRLALVKGDDGSLRTLESAEPNVPEDLLRIVFWDGELREQDTLDQVRDRAAEPFKTTKIAVPA